MKRSETVLDPKRVTTWEQKINDSFTDRYKHYVEAYQKYGVTLSLRPCYYYRGKYHTNRNSNCFLAFRIRIFPECKTYSQAVLKHCYKEFFSHKLGTIAKHGDTIRLTTYSVNDVALCLFLDKYLKKLQDPSVNNIEAIKEVPGDVLRSIVFIYRFRSELKRTYRGRDLSWIFICIVIFLISLSAYFHIKRLT